MTNNVYYMDLWRSLKACPDFSWREGMSLMGISDAVVVNVGDDGLSILMEGGYVRFVSFDEAICDLSSRTTRKLLLDLYEERTGNDPSPVRANVSGLYAAQEVVWLFSGLTDGLIVGKAPAPLRPGLPEASSSDHAGEKLFSLQRQVAELRRRISELERMFGLEGSL